MFCVCSVGIIITANVPALGEVANFGTNYFLSKIKFLARNKREFTTKFAILPNACCVMFLIDFKTVIANIGFHCPSGRTTTIKT